MVHLPRPCQDLSQGPSQKTLGEAEEPVRSAGESEAGRKGARRSEKAKVPEEGGLTRSSEAKNL
jgi:hypothetical protein